MLYDISYMWNLNRNDTNELTRQETDTQTLRTSLWLPEGRMVGRDRELGMDNQQGPTVEHMELCSMLCSNLDGRGVWGRMDT